MWQTLIHLAFLLSAMALAYIDRLLRSTQPAHCTRSRAHNFTRRQPRETIMTTILKADDLIESVAAALQYISYYHPADYIAHLARAYDARAEPGRQGRDRADPHQLAHERRGPAPDLPGHRHRQRVPEDRHGRALRGLHAASIADAVNEGVRRGYLNPDNMLRASIVGRPASSTRKNTKDNTPAVIHMELVPGDKVDVHVAAKGGGSENKMQVRDDESERQRGRLGAQDRAD